MRLDYQIPGEKAVSMPLEELRRDPSFEPLAGKFKRDFGLAALAEDCRFGSVDEAALDGGIAALRADLRNFHPVIPLLTGEVQVENPELQVPLVFKWGSPSVKELNDTYLGVALTDEFFKAVQALVTQFLGEGKLDGLPVLSLLNFNFKGGEAILNLNSPDLGIGDPRSFFEKKVASLQEKLSDLLAQFFVKRDPDWDPTFCPSAHMVFETSDWSLAEDPLALKPSDYVEGLLLSEHVVNMSRRRLHGPYGMKDLREDCVWRTPQEYDHFLKKDLAEAIGHFATLFEAKAKDPQWNSILTFLPHGSEELPFLKDAALQSLRKGTFTEDCSFVSKKEQEVLSHFVEVVNTVDVLKPFLHQNSAVFYERVERIAGVLKEEPAGLEEKKSYFLKLMAEASNSIKNQEISEAGDEILGTRLGLTARIHQVFSSEHGSEAVLLTGDVVGFGPINLATLYVDALNHLRTQDDSFDPKALKALLLSAGDTATEFLRHGDTILRETYRNPRGQPYLDGSGGDEIRALVNGAGDEKPLVLKHQTLLFERPVRLTSTDLSGLKAAGIENVPELLAAVSLVSENVFAALKKRGAFGPVALVVGK